ncbi:DUF7284 family protein [Haloparvum sp. PAK95]|uniref:DUF7284 family protein n=1 Tax=Haloparvum sp. PAK95 TaxID=3418962 RepID=UPI003D2F1366
MTSTVLDVTVFLLCVSASVGTLVAGGPAPAGDAPDAQATADRIATVTGTVRFTVSNEEGERVRRHQATLSVLLANAALATDASGSAPAREPSGTEDDPAVAGDGSAGDGSAGDGSAGDGSAGVSEAPSYSEAVLDLVSTRIGSRTRVVARPTGRSDSEHSGEDRSDEEHPAQVAVGPKPPRDADVAVAAFSVPAGSESEYVRIVVRRWSHA